jgi:hypothetical protein
MGIALQVHAEDSRDAARPNEVFEAHGSDCLACIVLFTRVDPDVIDRPRLAAT